MAKQFYDRLKVYYLQVGAVLRGEAGAASVFPNTTDIGSSRERVYAEFLKTHLPSCCNVFFGGFVFNLAGDESKQVDVLVTSDVCPQFNFANPAGHGKTFACVEGLLASASIKSTLNSAELLDSLANIASLPSKDDLGKRAMPLLQIGNYEDWPFKIIYASDGVSLETLLHTLNQFYQTNPHIPVTSRPNLIHVAGKYNVVKIGSGGGKTRDGTVLPEHTFHPHPDQTDVFALAYAVQNIQKNAAAARHVLFTYDAILDGIPF
ncbi:MAG TPA: DUF6602 domain-containing protein [Gemmataceae bacterium]|nr:DUF6602 domain-containing protein [Gemmataceae bacterium]